MITIEQYFGEKILSADATPERLDNAEELLIRVNGLLAQAYADEGYFNDLDPDTGTQISGSKGGAGDGGFRLQKSKTGAKNSKHKDADAVDVFDSGNVLDDWLTDKILEVHSLYREAPSATPGWCHLQKSSPGSKRRTFNP